MAGLPLSIVVRLPTWEVAASAIDASKVALAGGFVFNEKVAAPISQTTTMISGGEINSTTPL